MVMLLASKEVREKEMFGHTVVSMSSSVRVRADKKAATPDVRL
jgi:hypothetical protein